MKYNYIRSRLDMIAEFVEKSKCFFAFFQNYVDIPYGQRYNGSN